MKKFFAVLFALVLCLGLFAGCAETPTENGDTGTTNTDPSGGTDNDKDNDNNDNNDDKDKDDGEPIPEESWEEDGALKILMIGNSFSDDAIEHTYEIAKSLGIEEVVVADLFIGGCTVEQHCNNARLNAKVYDYHLKDAETVVSGGTRNGWLTVQRFSIKDALQSQDWDFISLQQASNESGHADSLGALDELMRYVRKYAVKTAKLVWQLSWSDVQNTTYSNAYDEYDRDQIKTYNAFVKVVKENILTRDFYTVIPTGTVIQNARSSFIGDTLNRDGHHLSFGLGRYIAGVGLIKVLTGLELTDALFAPDGVEEAEKAVAIEAANNAAANPFEITQSIYTEKA